MPPVLASQRLRIAIVLAGAAGLSAAAAGCGSIKRNENPNLVQGKQLFVAKCGSCHTLAHASTKGVIGPNLDVAFRQSLADGLRRDTVRTVVSGQIENPNPFGAMPRDLVSGRQRTDVAAYVARVADVGGQDTGLLATAVKAAGAGKPAVERAGKLEIDADPTGQLAYVTNKATAKPGAVTITMKNQSTVQHNIAVQTGTNGAKLGSGAVVGGGGVSTVKVSLKAGTYAYFCEVPGHRAAGMLGTITVK